jgi:hypothetical protein
VLAACLVAVLLSGLRPDTFFAGDSGVKLIAARAAAANPSHPLDVALPQIGGQPVAYVEPFFAVHGDHSHAVTSELFPLVTAPVLAVAGIRGVYVWPAIGLVAALWAISALGRALDQRRTGWVIAVVGLLASPLLFYGLEFWEHAPAVACGAAAALAFVRRRPVLSGVLFGTAALLRPEAVWFAVAVVASSPLLPSRPRPGQVVLVAVGALAAAAPLTLYAIEHFHALVPPHLSANASLLGSAWAGERVRYVVEWSGTSTSGVWRTMPALVAGAIASAWAPSRTGRGFLWSIAVWDTALVIATAPNDGGAQWGPRYLLFVCVPLVVLAADAVTWGIGFAAMDASDSAAARVSPSTNRGAVLVLAVGVLAAGVWTARDGYRTLHGTKATYGELVDAIRQSTASTGPFVVTDVWWIDQAAAADGDRATFLFVDGDAAKGDVMRRLETSGVRAVTAVTRMPPGLEGDAWPRHGCFDEAARTDLPRHQLAILQLSCEP